jgi:hypothetical protein
MHETPDAVHLVPQRRGQHGASVSWGYFAAGHFSHSIDCTLFFFIPRPTPTLPLRTMASARLGTARDRDDP